MVNQYVKTRIVVPNMLFCYCRGKLRMMVMMLVTDKMILNDANIFPNNAQQPERPITTKLYLRSSSLRCHLFLGGVEDAQCVILQFKCSEDVTLMELTACSEVLSMNWNDINVLILPIYRELMDHGVRAWMFSGDVHSVVPVTTRYVLAHLKLETKIPWYPWNVKKQIIQPRKMIMSKVHVPQPVIIKYH